MKDICYHLIIISLLLIEKKLGSQADGKPHSILDLLVNIIKKGK